MVCWETTLSAADTACARLSGSTGSSL